MVSVRVNSPVVKILDMVPYATVPLLAVKVNPLEDSLSTVKTSSLVSVVFVSLSVLFTSYLHSLLVVRGKKFPVKVSFGVSSEEVSSSEQFHNNKQNSNRVVGFKNFIRFVFHKVK